MKPFWKRKKEAYTIIAGCGRLGANLANTLSGEGASVLIIDSNKDAFRKLSPDFTGIVLAGDAIMLSTLHDAQIEKATTVVSVTNNDNTNILVAQIAKELFGIEHVIARLYDPERECVYQELNIETICPAVLSMKEINKLLNISEYPIGKEDATCKPEYSSSEVSIGQCSSQIP